MQRKQDKRNINTKLQIAMAFKDLAEKVPMNKITISSLTNYCGFNRNTFYYHFKDFYDLIDWLYEYEIDKLINESNIYDIKDLLARTFSYIEENKKLINSAYIYLGSDNLKRILHPYFYKNVYKIFDENINEIGLLDKNFKDFVIQFYCDGVASAILNFINDDSNLDKDTVIDYLLRLNNFILNFYAK